MRGTVSAPLIHQPAPRRLILRADLGTVATVAAVLISSCLTALASQRENPPALNATAESEMTETIIERVLESYAAAESYTIEFAQESYWALADTVSLSSARLVLVKPALLSVSYDDGGRIVSNGESLRVYVPATGQFFVSRIGSAGVVLDPAAILSNYKPDPHIPMITSSEAQNMVTIALHPKERFAEPTRIDVTIDTEAWIVIKLTAYSTAGDRSSYIFKSTTFEAPVAQSEFVLVRPEGAQLLTGSPYDIDQLR